MKKRPENGFMAVVVALAFAYVGPVVAQAGLVGHWKFDEGSGTTATDSSGNGYDLDRVNADGSWIAGKAGGAYNQPRFTADAAESDAMNLAGGGTVTLSLWVTVHSTANWAGMAGFEGTGSTGDIFGFKMDPSDHPLWTVLPSHGPFPTADTLANYAAATPDGWVHLVGVFEQGVGSTIYVNGAPAGTGAAGSPIPDKTPPGLFRIGTYYNSNSYEFNGAIDDVQVYDHALSAADVTYLYSNPGYALGEAPVEPPAVVNLSPPDNATLLAPEELVMTFDRAVTNHTTGSITLTNLTAHTADIIPITSTQVSITGLDLTITPTNPIADSSDYAVLIDTNAIKGVWGGTFFAGFTELTNWNFTTTAPDTTAPDVLPPFSPEDNSSGVSPFLNLEVTFDEPIGPGGGNVVISNRTDVTATVISVTDTSQVTISNETTLVISPADSLLKGKEYSVLIDTNAVQDPSGNFFAGITDTTTWNFATRAAGLIGHWPFDEGAGNTAADLSPLGHDLVRQGTAGSWVAGKSGNAYNRPAFQPADSSDYQDPGAVTVSAWIKPNAANGYQVIAGIDQYSGGNDMYALKTDSSDRVQWFLKGGATLTSTDTLSNFSAASADGWVHVVGVYDPGVSTALYVDGIPDASGVGPASNPVYAQAFGVGVYWNRTGTSINAAIDGVQIYDKALSAEDVLYLLQNPGYTLDMAPSRGSILLVR